MTTIKKTEKKRFCSGQEIVEWWFIVTLVACAVIGALLTWGSLTNDLMNALMEALNTVQTSINTST